MEAIEAARAVRCATAAAGWRVQSRREKPLPDFPGSTMRASCQMRVEGEDNGVSTIFHLKDASNESGSR